MESELEEVDLATPSNAEKLEPEIEPELELMTLSLREVVYGEWNDSEDGNWRFLPSEDGTCSIRPLSSKMKRGAVTIPNEVDGFTVISIGLEAFYSCDSLTEVNMPSIETIGSGAFKFCGSLTKINSPNIKTIGDNAFSVCSSLTEVNMPVVETIGDHAFHRCTSLVKIDLPNVKKIGSGAFNINKSTILGKEPDIDLLTEINLPSVETIGSGAFSSRDSIKIINLPNVETIGSGAFQNCKSLTEVNLPNVETIEQSAFENCTSLMEVNLPNVKTIGRTVFQGCKKLSDVNIGRIGTVVSIESSIFNDCTDLQNLTIGEIKIINEKMFNDCDNLQTLNIGKIDAIYYDTFSNKKNLQSVIIGEAGKIDSRAFINCVALTDLNLSTVGTIGDSAFRKCTGLTELNIGSVGNIEASAFANCTNLTNVTIDEVSGTVKEYAFNNSGVETINIGSINNAEYNSLVATEKITIGYAENLGGAKAKNIEITSGNNVMCGNYWPSNYAFNNSNMCETITIGDVTGTVKAFAFNNVTIESADNIIADADVVDIKNANEITKVNGREVNITEANYLRNITDADYENSWRINGSHNIEKLNITHVGEIDNRCFYKNENLNTVIIESAGTIGDSAFEDCSALSDLQIGTADKIGRMAFSRCSSLETLTTQDVGEIGERAFIITGLRTVDLGNVNKIGVGAFYSLMNLETVNMGNVGEIGEDAFAYNGKLTTVTMGEIHKIGTWAFANCTELETVNWTCKLESLPEKAFYYDGKLQSIDLGSDLKSIGHKALFKCNSIKELTIPAGVDTVNFVDLCGEYDYSGEADFSRGYKLTFLGDNTDFEIRYGEEDAAFDNDDSIIINELVLPSKNSKAYKRIRSVDNTDIINTIDGGRSNVVYHAVANNTKATYKTGSINIDGVISNYIMLTPYSDGNMGKEVDWSWWSVYKDIGNEVGDSSNVGGQGTGRVIQHTIIPVIKIGDEIIDGSTEDKKETVTVRFWKNDGTEDIFKIEYREKGTTPDFTDTPTRENYDFIGWYKDPEGTQPVDVNESVEEDIDYYAKWEEKNTEDDNKEKVIVTFYNNDNTNRIFKIEQIEKGGTVNTNNKPNRDEYEFTG